MGRYFDEMTRAMTWLGRQEKVRFLGQAVAYPGTAMTNTLVDVPVAKKCEMPVCEEMQMGITVGMSLAGDFPVSIYPRWNFLLLAMNQLVNHLDKIKTYSHEEFAPHVIIRTGIGSESPLHPQSQHVGDFTDSVSKMLTNIDVVRLDESDQIFDAYKHAYERVDGRSTLLVEVSDFYNLK